MPHARLDAALVAAGATGIAVSRFVELALTGLQGAQIESGR